MVPRKGAEYCAAKLKRIQGTLFDLKRVATVLIGNSASVASRDMWWTTVTLFWPRYTRQRSLKRFYQRIILQKTNFNTLKSITLNVRHIFLSSILVKSITVECLFTSYSGQRLCSRRRTLTHFTSRGRSLTDLYVTSCTDMIPCYTRFTIITSWITCHSVNGSLILMLWKYQKVRKKWNCKESLFLFEGDRMQLFVDGISVTVWRDCSSVAIGCLKCMYWSLNIMWKCQEKWSFSQKPHLFKRLFWQS